MMCALQQPIYQIASLLLSGVNKYVYLLFESCGFYIVGNIAAWLQRNFKESLISYMLIFSQSFCYAHSLDWHHSCATLPSRF